MMAVGIGSAHDPNWIGISAIKEETRFPVRILDVARHFAADAEKT